MSKKLIVARSKVDRMTQYSLEDAVALLKEICYATASSSEY